MTRPGRIECPHSADGKEPDGRHCSSCWGWKEVIPGHPNEFCHHDYDTGGRTVGNCLTVWVCQICGYETTVDSS